VTTGGETGPTTGVGPVCELLDVLRDECCELLVEALKTADRPGAYRISLRSAATAECGYLFDFDTRLRRAM
jgi:hypothetical protein